MKECNYEFYNEEFRTKYRQNKKMSKEMEETMQNHKFVMFLQPIVNLRSSKIVSAEALVRWDYPGKGLLSPYAFLPVFEGTAFIDKISELMNKYLIKKDQIVLEIPEQGITSHMDTMNMIMNKLNEENFSVCIDGFGSVNSPLNLLKDYKIGRIKIDRNFLNKNVASEEGQTIIFQSQWICMSLIN